MEGHDRLRAEAVSEHREGGRPAVSIGVAEELPRGRRLLQGLLDFGAQSLSGLGLHGRIVVGPSTTGDEIEVRRHRVIVVSDSHRMCRDIHVAPKDPACEAIRLRLRIFEEAEDTSEERVYLFLRSVHTAQEPLCEVALLGEVHDKHGEIGVLGRVIGRHLEAACRLPCVSNVATEDMAALQGHCASAPPNGKACLRNENGWYA
mmetsp:Transcript_60043/g.128869  ORF Transcript_60043/g.128869 Transcript_60043/m.128869 type:complete len:204 (-) Transcript_60043:2-613(-)